MLEDTNSLDGAQTIASRSSRSGFDALKYSNTPRQP